MIDISKNELIIKAFEGGHKNYLEPKFIPFCRPRRCDAFVYILSGSCIYVFNDGRSFVAEAGNVIYLSGGAVYEMTVRERYDFICVNFFFDSKEPRKSDLFSSKDKETLENLFYRTWRIQAGGSLPIKMSLVYRIYGEMIALRTTSYASTQHKALIEETASIITDSACDDISVSALARQAGMSEVYFRRLFRKVMGTSPARFMIDCRVSHAKELLFEDYLTLEEISERCGFSSLSYFCRVFKASTGMTPGEFRAKLSE